MRIKKIFHSKLVNTHSSNRLIILSLILGFSYHANSQIWSLNECIDTALVHNKNLQISQNICEIGEQKHKEALSNLIPKVNALGDYKYFIDLPYQLMPLSTFNPVAPEGQFKEAQFGVPHNFNTSVQLSMPLYNPQLFGGIKSTKIAAEINELQYKNTEVQLFFDISSLYYNTQILQHQLNYIDSNILNTNKLLDNMVLLYQQLIIKQSDITKVELQKEQLLTQRQLILNAIEQMMSALKFTMGIAQSQTIQIEPDIKYVYMNEYSLLPTIEQQIISKQNSLLKNDLNILKNSRLPSVSIYGSYGQNGFGYDKEPNDFLKFFPSSFAGIQINYPLFNGTTTYRKINQKKIELENNELQMSLINDQNTMLIENAKRRKVVTQKTISNTVLQIDLAKTIYAQTLIQQKEGTANLTDVLLADNALREAQQSHLTAIIDYLKADLELKKLTGNLTQKN